MENAFKSFIDQSKSILIILPTKPYFDQVAAGLGLYLCLRDIKDVQVSCPTPMTVEFNRLVGVNKISSEMGNKNLIIRFIDYKASDIERVSYDIENSQFRLTVIPKQKLTPPGKDQVELAYSGVSADSVILIGGANETHFPAITSKELAGANIAHIGNRDVTTSTGRNFISFSRPATSVSEVVALLLNESSLKISEDTATDLLMGLENATANLTDPGMTADTFSVVSQLMRLGGRRSQNTVTQQPRVYQQFQNPGQPGTYPRVAPQFNPVNPGFTTAVRPQAVMEATPKVTEANPTNQNASDEKPPSDWLQPKIFKGTNVS